MIVKYLLYLLNFTNNDLDNINNGIVVETFDKIPSTYKLSFFIVNISIDSKDPNCPYPNDSLMWWNVIQLGIGNRQTQIACQALSNRSGYNECWIRQKHDALWSNWRCLN